MFKYASGIATVAAATFAAAAPAQAQSASGYVTLRGASNEIEIFEVDGDSIESYAVDGAVVFRPTSGRYNIQLNGEYESWSTATEMLDENGDPIFVDDNGDPIALDDSAIFSGDAHLFWGRSNSYTVGGFASVFEYDLFDLVNETTYGGGLELDLHTDIWTTGMQAGYFVEEDDGSLFAAAGQSRVYPVPSFSLEGSAAVGRADNDLVEGDVYGLGAEAEYQFEGTPLSVFGGARFSEAVDYDLEQTAIQIGVRLNLGSRTLFERDRTGASMRGSQAISDLLAIPAILQPAVAPISD